MTLIKSDKEMLKDLVLAWNDASSNVKAAFSKAIVNKAVKLLDKDNG